MTARLRVDPDGHGIWLGNRHVPWAVVAINTFEFEDFTHRRRQAVVPMENGLMLSLIWGDGTYSSNSDRWLNSETPFTEEPTNVELAILAADGLVRLGGDGDTVEGYVPVSFLGAWIDFVGALPTDTVAVDQDATP